MLLETRHQVVVMPLPDQFQVVLAGESSVHDHRGAALASGPGFQSVEHGLHGGAVDGVPGVDLMPDGKTVRVQHQPHGHQLAIRPHLLAVAPHGLRVPGRLAFEVGVGHVIEHQRAFEIEQGLLPRIQFPLDLQPVPVELVHVPVELVLVQLLDIHAQDIVDRLPLGPAHHGELRAGIDQAVQGHHLGQLARRRRKAHRLQDRLHLQALPHLMAHVERADFPEVLTFDARGLHRHHIRDGDFTRERFFQFGRAGLGLALTDPRHRLVHPGIREQRRLAAQGHLDALGQQQPVLFGAGIHLPQVADGLVPRPGGRQHRLHQHVADVGLATLLGNGSLDEHDKTNMR